MSLHEPTEQVAKDILFEVFGKRAILLQRFSTGLAHYVYDVTTDDGKQIVIRLARHELKKHFEGAIYWYGLLKPKGIPLPKLLYSDTTGKHDFPVIFMERLPGKDLGLVYQDLSSEQKKDISRSIVEIQTRVATLPNGSGYGNGASFEDSDLKSSWSDVIHTNLERSRARIEASNVIDLHSFDKVINAINIHRDYFSSIKPNAYLDDTTTKNVIVDGGKITGIVDVDNVAFGDYLMTPALTKVSLVSAGNDTEYTDFWIEGIKLSDEQIRAFKIYVAVYCLDLLSEQGQYFNKSTSIPVDERKIARLTTLFNESVM